MYMHRWGFCSKYNYYFKQVLFVQAIRFQHLLNPNCNQESKIFRKMCNTYTSVCYIDHYEHGDTYKDLTVGAPILIFFAANSQAEKQEAM